MVKRIVLLCACAYATHLKFHRENLTNICPVISYEIKLIERLCQTKTMDLQSFQSINTKKLEKQERYIFQRLTTTPAASSISSTMLDSASNRNTSLSPTWTKRKRHYNAHNEIHNFRDIFTYLSSTKVQAADKVRITCLSWNEHNTLAYGCKNGFLKILTFGNPNADSLDEISISKNQTLSGHANASENTEISHISWNRQMNKLASADKNGLVIIWKLACGSSNGEFEPKFNSQSQSIKSKISSMSWSNNGRRICFVYENGFVKVGSVGGGHLWRKHVSQLQPIANIMIWSKNDRELLIPTESNNEIQVFDAENGNHVCAWRLSILSSVKYDHQHGHQHHQHHGSKQYIVSVKWFLGNQTLAVELPTLAVLFSRNLLCFLRDFQDTSPTVIETNLISTMGDWSPNGDYFAICGKSAVDSSDSLTTVTTNKVILFSAAGNLLHEILLPTTHCPTSLSWNPTTTTTSSSLSLAICAGSTIYFANVRPNYKYTFYAKCVFAYAFGSIGGSTHIGFWNQQTHKTSIQDISGLVVDLKGNDSTCSILTCDRNGIYTVLLVNEEGIPIDKIHISNLTPFILIQTETCVSCVAGNAVLIWKYSTVISSSSNSSTTTKPLKELELSDVVKSCKRNKLQEITFHLDELKDRIRPTPISGPEDASGDKKQNEDYLSWPSKDPAVCADGVNQLLIIVRESGKILLCSLPHGTFISQIHSAFTMNIQPRRAFVSTNGTQLALLDSIGTLSILNLASNPRISIPKATAAINSNTLELYDIRDVSDVMWAKDNPNQLCILEKTKLYVIENGKIEDPITVASSPYFINFKNLQVTTILMEKLLKTPAAPNSSMILRFDTKLLVDLKFLLAQDSPMTKLQNYIEDSYSSSSNAVPYMLWNLLGSAALQKLNIELAQLFFLKSSNYSWLQFIKKLQLIQDPLIRQAEIACLNEDYEFAEELYLKAGRRDLAIEMWKLIGDWEQEESLANRSIVEPFSTCACTDEMSVGQRVPFGKQLMKSNVMKADFYAEQLEWKKALPFYKEAQDFQQVLECAIILEDYQTIEQLKRVLPSDSDLMKRIAEFYDFLDGEES